MDGQAECFTAMSLREPPGQRWNAAAVDIRNIREYPQIFARATTVPGDVEWRDHFRERDAEQAAQLQPVRTG